MKEEFLFEVFDRFGTRLFYTFKEECVPEQSVLKHMSKNLGYKFKMNGKVYKV